RDAGFLLLGLDHHAREIGGAPAHVAEDLLRRPPLGPVDVAQLDAADDVLFRLAAEADAAARIDRLELRHVEDPRFDLADEEIALEHGQIAAGVDVQHRLARLDLREELDAAAED